MLGWTRWRLSSSQHRETHAVTGQAAVRLHCLDPSEVLLMACLTLMIVEGEINHLIETGQALPKGGEIIVVEIEDFFVLHGLIVQPNGGNWQLSKGT